MGTNISVKTKIRVNGQDYASVEAMPPDIRQVYERTLATLGADKPPGIANPAGPAPVATISMIVFNGQEYASAEHMPADVRRLYDRVIGTLEADRGPARTASSGSAVAAGPVSAGAIRPEPTNVRWIIVGVAIAVLLLVSILAGR